MTNKNLVLVSGYSGSGKTHTLKYFENCGYYCVDNLPLQLLIPYLDLYFNNNIGYESNHKIAIGIDVRSTSDFSHCNEIIGNIKKSGFNFKLLFMTADKNVLVKRFKETRNFHPINLTLELAIEKEIEMLNPLRRSADLIFDTTNTNVHELRQHIYSLFLDDNIENNMLIRVVSFGFSKGIPLDLDLLFDVRFLPNPYFVPELKNFTGKDELVGEFLENKDIFTQFWEKLTDMLNFLIPLYRKEGKSYLSIGVGCTGGKHRSVFIAEKLSKYFSDYSIKLEHRDILK